MYNYIKPLRPKVEHIRLRWSKGHVFMNVILEHCKGIS